MKRAAIILAAGLAASGGILAARRALHRVDASPPAAPPAAAPLKPGEPVPDAPLVNQEGRRISLSDFKGRTLVLTFIYTRCNVQTMCPMATRRLQEVQAVARRRNLDVHFLVVSFDPEDRPDMLLDYARRHDVDLSNWDFATGSPEVVGPLARTLNTYYRRTAGAVFEHNIVVSLVDARGILRDDFFGADWDPEELVRALSALSLKADSR